MKTFFSIIIIFMSVSSFAKESCHSILSEEIQLTESLLGNEWRHSKWRNGALPFRYYNFSALDRVVKDPDLIPLAIKWIKLNRKEEANKEFQEVTYDYIVALGDLRIKYDIPLGGVEDKPKPLLNFINLIMKRNDSGENIDQFLDLMKKFNSFFHPDGGLYLDRKDEYHEFLNTEFIAKYHVLMMSEAIKF